MHRLGPVSLLIAAALTACQTQSTNVPLQTTITTSPAPALSAVKQITSGKTPHGMGAALGFVYNSNVGEGTLSVIDANTDTVVKTIPFPDGNPGYVKAFHDGKHLLVTDTKKGALLVFDPAQDHKLLQTIPTGQGVDKVRIDEDDKTVLVSMTGERFATVFTFGDDRAQAPTRKDIAIGTATGEHRDANLAHGWAVVPNNGDNNVSLINVATGAVQNVSGGNSPGPVAIGSSSGAAVVAIVGNTASNTISFFDLPSGTATTLDNVGLAPTDIAVDPQLHRAYLTMAGSNNVAVVDYLTKKLVGMVPAGNRPVHIYMTSSPTELWVGNDAGASVTIFDGDSLRVKATVATDAGHHKMAFWGTKGYVSNITANNISVVDRTMIK